MRRPWNLILLIICAISIVPLYGCTSGKSVSKSTHSKTIKTPIVTASGYVENLSLARLELADGAEDAPEYIAILKSYISQKKRKAEKATLAIIEYKTKGNLATKKTLAVIALKKTDFPSLQTVMDKLGKKTIQNIRVASAVINPSAGSVAILEKPDQLAEGLETLHQEILEQSKPLATVDDIKLQLSLIAFFTQHRYQDAAYLSLDNTKRKLAELSEHKTLDEVTLKSLSKELETLEANLKKELPYSL